MKAIFFFGLMLILTNGFLAIPNLVSDEDLKASLKVIMKEFYMEFFKHYLIFLNYYASYKNGQKLWDQLPKDLTKLGQFQQNVDVFNQVMNLLDQYLNDFNFELKY